MKIRSITSMLLVSLLLLAPAARAAETGAEPVAEGTVAEATPQGGEAGETAQIRVADDEDDSKEPKATKGDVEAVHNEVEVLRDQWQRSLERALPYTVVQSNRPLIIGGTGQLRYNQVFNNEKTNPTTFSVNFFSLNFSGNLRKDYQEGKNIDYTLGIQTTGSAAVSITDAWLSYQILNSLDKEGPRLSITAGQQKKYFGLEATATEAFKPTIVTAQFATNLSLDERDIGLVLAGDLFPANDYGYNYRVPTVQYWLGVINGTGPNKSDDNDEKDIFTRVALNAPVNYDNPLRGLTLGASWYYGRKSYATTNTKTTTVTVPTTTPGTNATITTATTTDAIIKKGDKTRWGVDLSYVNTPVGFTFEYVQGRDLLPASGTVRNGAVTKPYSFRPVTEEGITFTLFYNFGDQFVNSVKQQDRYDDWFPLTYQPFYRYDRYTPDMGHTNTYTEIHTLGFNWFFAQTTKLQINYNLKKEYPVDKHNDQLLVQFQFGF